MSEGENMFAFQVCNIPKTDQKIIHCEFLGIIAEEEEEDDEQENEDNKRGIDDVDRDGGESGQDAKRPKRA